MHYLDADIADVVSLMKTAELNVYEQYMNLQQGIIELSAESATPSPRCACSDPRCRIRIISHEVIVLSCRSLMLTSCCIWVMAALQGCLLSRSMSTAATTKLASPCLSSCGGMHWGLHSSECSQSACRYSRLQSDDLTALSDVLQHVMSTQR